MKIHFHAHGRPLGVMKVSFYKNENEKKMKKRENIVCPVCKSKDVTLRSKKKINDYSVYICSNCTLKFVNPFRVDTELYDNLYKPRKHYDYGYGHMAKTTKKYLKENQLKKIVKYHSSCHPRFKYFYKHIFEKVNKNKHMLEIGCGLGYVTATLNALGYNCIGVDISPIAIDRARENFPGSKFYSFDELMKEKDSLSFEFIFGLDVLEHLDDFQVINQYLDILNYDGYLGFSVPQSTQYIWHGEFPPIHLSLWNKTSITALYNNLGLKTRFFYENKTISSIGTYTIRRFITENIDIVSGRDILQTNLNGNIKPYCNKNINKEIIKTVKKILIIAIGIVSYPVYVNTVNGNILFAIAQKTNNTPINNSQREKERMENRREFYDI